MQNAWTRTICRLLVALMIWTPCYIAQAGMIAAESVATTQTQASADRTTILNFIDRSDVQARLQSMGIDTGTAKTRVAALSDAEAATLAKQIQTAPAGASDDWAWVLLVIVIAAGVWWFFFRK